MGEASYTRVKALWNSGFFLPSFPQSWPFRDNLNAIGKLCEFLLENHFLFDSTGYWTQESLGCRRLWEVCRATAAAPTYFPPAYVQSVDGKTSGTLIDGGAIQNNPVSISLFANMDEMQGWFSVRDLTYLNIAGLIFLSRLIGTCTS